MPPGGLVGIHLDNPHDEDIAGDLHGTEAADAAGLQGHGVDVKLGHGRWYA